MDQGSARLERTVIGIVCEVAGRDPSSVTPMSRLAQDLDIKSANRIELGILVGQAVGRQISVFDILTAKTVGDVISLASPADAATPA